MAQELINVGNVANDGTGDPLRTAFEKINNNFSEIFSTPVGAGPNGSIQYNTVTIGTGATAVATIAGGAVTQITVVSPGINYLPSDIPLVTITTADGDTTGFGATAVAVLDNNGGVASITITESGSGYTLPPNIEIQTITNNLLTGTANLLFNDNNNTLTLNASILPKIGGQVSIGNSTSPISGLYVGQTALRVGNIAVEESGNTLSFNVATLPTKKADFVINNLSANKISYGNTATLAETSIETVSDSPNQVAISFPVSTYSTCTFEICSRDDTANTQSTTIVSTLNNDTTGVRFNSYGAIFIGDPLVTYDMDVVDGQVRLLLSPLSSVNMMHKLTYKLVK